jgi:hypothetical protein
MISVTPKNVDGGYTKKYPVHAEGAGVLGRSPSLGLALGFNSFILFYFLAV